MLRIKRLLVAASLLLTLFAPLSFGITITKCATGLPVPIPSNNPTGITSSITIADTGNIQSLKLTDIKITHNFIGEISAFLTNGTETAIIGSDPGAPISLQGCSGANITGLIVSDSGAKTIENDCKNSSNPAYDPAFQYKPMELLSKFNGDSISGTWSLNVADNYSYDIDTGTLDSWCLEYTRLTNGGFTPTPANGTLIDFGTPVYYPGGVTKDIFIEVTPGDSFQINKVEFANVSPSPDANGDFIGTITKESPAPLTIINDSKIKKGKPHTNAITLAPGEKYRFSAQCKPTGIETRKADFKITTNLPAPNDILSFPLTCNGDVALYKASYDGTAISDGDTKHMGAANLGGIPIDDSKLTIKNEGNYNMNVSASFVSGGSADISIQSPSFPLTLTPGQTPAAITLRCAPTVAGGVRSRTLRIKSTVSPPSPSDIPNLTSEDYTFTCSGNSPVALLTPSSGGTVNVGTVLEGNSITSSDNLIGVRNDNGQGSTVPLTLSNYTISGASASGVFSVVSSPSSVAANTTDGTGIKVTCNAAALTGSTPIHGTDHSATLTFNTDDPAKSTVSFTLQCNVKAKEPTATLDPVATTLLNFNTVGSGGGILPIGIGNSSADKALKVTYDGFTDTTVGGAAAFQLLDSSSVLMNVNDSVSIGIGVNLTNPINVKCKSGLAAGTYTATLKLTTDDPKQKTIDYPVSCTVATTDDHPLYNSVPAPNISTPILVGSMPIGTAPGVWSAPQPVIQVSEIGNDSLKVDFGSLDNPDFEIDSSTVLPFTIGDGDAPKNINVKCRASNVVNTATLTLKATDVPTPPGVPVPVANYPTPTYKLSCTGLLPAYASTPASGGTINVGTTPLGTSVSATLNITNTGISSNPPTRLAVNTPVISGTHPNDFLVTGLPITVEQGSPAANLTVTCAPTVIGLRTATLKLTTNDPNATTVTYTLNCTGTAGSGAVYGSIPAVFKNASNEWRGEIDFGNVPLNTPVQRTLTISELGLAPMNAGEPVFTVGTPNPFTIDNYSSLFLPGGTTGASTFNPGFFIPNNGAAKVINFTCQPTTEGLHTATLKLLTNDPAKTPTADPNKFAVTYTLKCNGVKSKYSSIPAPSSELNCGNTPLLVGNNMTETITVTELGTKDLKLSSPSFSGADSGDFSIVSPTFPVTIADGGAIATTQDIKVKFAPSAAGTRVATLTFATDDPDNLTVSYNFSCPAISPGFSSTPAPGNLNCGGATAAGFDRVETLSITETLGNVDLVVDSATFSGTNSGEFSILSPAPTDFPLTIAKGTTAAQEIKVKFKPTAIGTRTATLTLAIKDTTTLATNGTTTKAVTYNLSCQAVTPPGYSSNPAPSSTLNCGGTTTLTGANYMETLNISETGNSSDLIVNSAALSGAHAGDFAIFSPSIPMTVAKATAQDIKVRFSPTAAGTRTATLTVNSNDLSNATMTYTLSCKAEVPPAPPVIATRTLTVAVTPSEGGTVNDDLGQIRCGKGTTACSGIFDINTAINLTATAATGYQFKNWTGDCATGSVMLNSNKACTANFEAVVITPPDKPTDPTQPTDPTKPVEPGKPTDPSKPVEPGKPTDPSKPTDPGKPTTPDKPPVVPPTTDPGSGNYTVTVAASGKGSGKISGDSISCGDGGTGKCSHTVPAGTQMIFSAQPNSGSTFLGWSGHCEGKTAIAIVNMTEHKQCVARFELLATEPEKEDDGLGNYCTGKGYTNISCNARGAVIGDIDGKIEVDSAGYLSNGIVTKPLINKGWVANLTIEDTGSLTGGIVTGSIINKGEMSNFEFRGDILSGGKLSGVIKNNSPNVCFADGIVRGVIKDVSLAANTKILGGRVSGKIVGDSQSPARLSKVILTGETSLTHVLLEENVIIEQDVSHETTKMTKVKLAPNLKIRGGKISGELTGEEAAPAHLSNMLIKSGTELENVVLDEQVVIEDEKTCTAQQLEDNAAQNPTDAAESETGAIALNPNGKQLNSTSHFNVQLATSQGKRTNKTILSQTEAKTVNLSAQVAIQAEHTGKSAEMLIVVQHKNAQQTSNYMKTATGWKVWDGQLSHLQPLETYQQLPANIDLSVFSGDLSQEGGEFNLYAGYRLQDGTLVFNGQNPLRFAVTRTKESCALTCGCQ